MPEILIILFVVLLFFGPSKLPGLGKSLGEALRGFKKGVNDASDVEKPAKIVSEENHQISNSDQAGSAHKQTEKKSEKI